MSGYIQTPPQDITFHYSLHGKPFIKDAPQFNLSHSGTRGLLGICLFHDIGIDVETENRDISPHQLAQRVLSTSEHAAYSAAPGKTAFLKMWTRKEAYTKGLATGISLSLNEISINPDCECRYQVQHQHSDNHTPWYCFDLALPQGYVGAVATLISNPSIVNFQWP